MNFFKLKKKTNKQDNYIHLIIQLIRIDGKKKQIKVGRGGWEGSEFSKF